MARAPKQKMKLLFIIKMLMEHTDENHPMPTQEIIRRLLENDIRAERKSIYNDIYTLMDFGYDIIHVPTRNGGGYYLGSRDFELAELKLLVDAVQSSRFITTKKSRELIKKLERLVSNHEAGQLQRQVFVAGQIKTENESVYYSIDNIHHGIQQNKQIKFVYLEWTKEKVLKPRKAGKSYIVSPWALIWKEENYYLAAFDSETNLMKHYRVDKIGNVEILSNVREGIEQFAQMDLAAYTNRTFGMFGGKEETVTMQFSNNLVGVVIDRFGKDVEIRPNSKHTFQIRTNVLISGQFFGWLTGIGKDAIILAPESAKGKYLIWLQEILGQY